MTQVTFTELVPGSCVQISGMTGNIEWFRSSGTSSAPIWCVVVPTGCPAQVVVTHPEYHDHVQTMSFAGEDTVVRIRQVRRVDVVTSEEDAHCPAPLGVILDVVYLNITHARHAHVRVVEADGRRELLYDGTPPGTVLQLRIPRNVPLDMEVTRQDGTVDAVVNYTFVQDVNCVVFPEATTQPRTPSGMTPDMLGITLFDGRKGEYGDECEDKNTQPVLTGKRAIQV